MMGYHLFNLYMWWNLILVYISIGTHTPVVSAITSDCVFSYSSEEGCCDFDFVNKSSIEVKFFVVKNANNSIKPWRLDVDITWDPVDITAPHGYLVEWIQTIEGKDFEDPAKHNSNTYDCSGTTSSECDYDADLVLPSLVTETKYTSISDDNLFGAQYYRLQIRIVDFTTRFASFTSVCQFSRSDMPTAPDCYEETRDVEFCKNEPILVAGNPVNITVVEMSLHKSENDNKTLVTLRLSWLDPIQVNGQILFYIVNVIDTTISLIVYKQDNPTSYNDILIMRLVNNTDYTIHVGTTVQLNTSSAIMTQQGNTGEISVLAFVESVQQTTTMEATHTQTPTHTQTMNPEPVGVSVLWIVISVVIVVIIAAILISLTLYLKCNSTETEETVIFHPHVNRIEIKSEENREELVEVEFKMIEIFKYSNIVEEGRLGSGQFGEVFKGKAILRGKTTWSVVAMKKPKNAVSLDVIEDFKNEIRLMLELGKHLNIISVLGCCTVDEPYYLLTDFMEHGDLLHFLRKCSDPANWSIDSLYKIDTINQLQIARQIADAMSFVSHTRFFHGDLAARNILVGNNLLIKVTDFGLTNDLYQKGYTRLQAGERRPYKWYSPESIEHQYCTLKTDIWSYGVLLWEILTFGQKTPYHGMSINEVLYKLKSGYRLTCPTGTPEYINQIMQSCWHIHPDERPEFADIFETLTFLLNKGTDATNYIILAQGEDEEEENEDVIKPDSPIRRNSLIFQLNLGSLDQSEICGSTCDYQFSASSYVNTLTLHNESTNIFTPVPEEEDKDEVDEENEGDEGEQ